MECYGKRDCHYEKTICTFVKTVNVTYKLWQIMEIDGWHRFDKAKDEVLREQYFDDPLFVTLYDAIENYETKLGGLTPAEVWSEVQDITNRLLRTKRPDKLLSTIRTDLIIRYSCFLQCRWNMEGNKGIGCGRVECHDGALLFDVLHFTTGRRS